MVGAILNVVALITGYVGSPCSLDANESEFF